MKVTNVHIILVCLLLGLFTYLTVGSALLESLTFDEIVHIQEGKNHLISHTFRIDTNNPPFIRELAVIPLVLGIQHLIPSSLPNMQAFPARAVIIMLGVLLGIAVYHTGTRYFGWKAGILGLCLYILEPEILAHSHYMTQDMGAALLFFLAYTYFLRVIEKPTPKRIILLSILCGLLAVTKITVVLYYIISIVLYLMVRFTRVKTSIGKHIWYMASGVFITLLIIWGTYFFNTSVIIQTGGSTDRVSVNIEQYAVAHGMPWMNGTISTLKTVRMPLGEYIEVIKNTAKRITIPVRYLFMGVWYDKPLWYFMPVNWFSKIPLPLFFLFILGLFLGLRKPKDRNITADLIIPIVAIFLVSSVSRMQPFTRYMLPVLPFIIVIAGSTMKYIRKNVLYVGISILMVWYGLGTLQVFPHFISYTNESVRLRTIAVPLFMDSNMDWGQGLITFKTYVDSVNPSSVSFSYFGRDNGAAYGLPADIPYGSYKFNEICAFHEISFPNNTGPHITAISLSNWFYCGYNLDPEYFSEKIKEYIGDSIFVFQDQSILR